MNDVIEAEELNEKPEKVQKPEDAFVIIKEYNEIIRTKRICSVSSRKSA